MRRAPGGEQRTPTQHQRENSAPRPGRAPTVNMHTFCGPGPHPPQKRTHRATEHGRRPKMAQEPQNGTGGTKWPRWQQQIMHFHVFLLSSCGPRFLDAPGAVRPPLFLSLQDLNVFFEFRAMFTEKHQFYSANEQIWSRFRLNILGQIWAL